ncbi:thiaminase /4-amino-5-aminomethyl-2-methylpyrimidine deaminase [Limimonas halophila]|uniref:Thiaminase /4-amino-5-aminomethyl-2-methylpyrimidine deaminase n=1 Tax=Limimonas halophila TaxID=1082479 RepID=A0A1G7QVB8_9PROT|nr:TenA family protein [Limimonas halophila]SDG01610.1 thiaminase /4-amino-5-aminomethyl-2-methylpyrimidine deaminase [Limimonas halophila]
MPFAAELCDGHANLVDRLITHPFLVELAAGTLPHACFRRFLEQDLYILAEEAKVFAVTASRAPTLAEAARLAALIDQLNVDEHSRHRVLLEHVGGAPDAAEFVPLPTTYAYANHLHARATDGHRVTVLAALLPCAHLYSQFGRRYVDAAPADPIYKTWLRAYQDGNLDPYIATHAQALDDAAAAAGEADRAAARQAFAISLHYEQGFLDMACYGEAWRWAGDGGSDAPVG